MKASFDKSSRVCDSRFSLIVTITMLMLLPAYCGERPGAPRGGGPAFRPAPAPRPAPVERINHGTIRHVDTHVVQRPAPRPEPPRGERPAPPRDEHREAPHEINRRPEFATHRDVDVDIHRHEFWHDFAFGRRLAVLPFGYVQLNIGGAPYYYDDGIYYQPYAGGYQEVYPPSGAEVPQPPDGAFAVDFGGATYYYAGGAFYLQQPDGQFAIVAPPIGAIVPELPPGATPVNINGVAAYQFGSVYYQPMFVNGVTQYQIFQP
jgi:hypothetical protein